MSVLAAPSASLLASTPPPALVCVPLATIAPRDQTMPPLTDALLVDMVSPIVGLLFDYIMLCLMCRCDKGSV